MLVGMHVSIFSEKKHLWEQLLPSQRWRVDSWTPGRMVALLQFTFHRPRLLSLAPFPFALLAQSLAAVSRGPESLSLNTLLPTHTYIFKLERIWWVLSFPQSPPGTNIQATNILGHVFQGSLGTWYWPSSCFSQSSRTTRSEEDRDSLWDAWGPWSECSRTCGGGASYSLRRCLSSR